MDFNESVHQNYDYAKSRLGEYPSIEQWMRAYLQKELDGQTEEWDNLVELRSSIKEKYPKLDVINNQ